MRRLLVLLVLLSCVPAHAGPQEEKARKLFEVQGVVSKFQAAVDEGRLEAQEETRQTLGQMLSQFTPNKEFEGRIKLVADKYAKNMQAKKTAQEIVDALVKAYAPNFTEQELDKLIEFYGSSVGKKDAAVSKSAMQKVAEHYKTENERVRVSATIELVRDLQLIAQQCNCSKQAKAKTK